MIASPPIDRVMQTPPAHTTEGEMALLGAMLLNPEIVPEVAAVVSAEDFYSEAHALIYSVLIDVADKEPNAALQAAHERLKRSDALETVGGVGYLAKLAQETPGPATAPYYAKTIGEYGRLRRLADIGARIMHRAKTDDSPSSAQIDSAEADIFALADHGGELSKAESIVEVMDREIARMESGSRGAGLPTHYRKLDELTGGFQPGDMIILAARPSMGKSALMLNMAEQMAIGGVNPSDHAERYRVGVFTMEMSRSSVAQRMLSARSGVSCSAMRTGGISGTAMEALAQAAVDLSAHIYIDDSTALTIAQVRSRARRMVAKWGVQILFIDYLQLMTAPGSSRESRQVEVSAISRGIKALARELNIPVVCLSQLNRSAEMRSGNRPRMADLRESGSIEQDADVVMLLHREDYYTRGEKDEAGNPVQPDYKAELIVAKQRNGPTDTVHLTWSPIKTRFENERWN